MKRNLLYIGNALSSKGQTVTTIDTLSALLEEFFTVKVASKKSNKLFRLIDMMVSVWRNRHSTDFVLIDTYSTINFYYAFIISQLCRLYKLKYIPILHGGNLESRLRHHPNKSKAIFKYSHKLVSPSLYLKSVFKNYGYLDVQHIPNSIEIDKYKFLNRNIGELRLLWVRSFAEIYNPDLAISVIEFLKDRGYNINLIMVGPEKDGTLKKIKELVSQRELPVKFTGLLSKSDWVTKSEECNLFINTSNIDNMPVSIIEAMALGLPVVSTNVGGLSYLIENRKEGLLVSPNNIEAMAEAILEIFEDDHLRQILIQNARLKAEAFDWKIIKQKWQSLLS